MNSFVKSLLNVIPSGLSTPSCLLNTISRNVPSGDNLCMSCGYNYNLLYNERNDQLLLRQDGERLCCINLDGHVIYRYDISGVVGLMLSFTAVTPQHISPIFILLSFVLLVVLINCMDPSHGRVTTALSVHEDRMVRDCVVSI
jgi:hypothetical protein